MADVVTKNLDAPDKSWTFLDGSKRAAVMLESVFIGRGEYLPGWRWSEHIGRQTGQPSQSHIGYILSGHTVVRSAGGTEGSLGPGDAFEVGPEHDAWVVGNEACVALDFGEIKLRAESGRTAGE